MDEHACLLRGRTLVADKGFDADGLPGRIRHFGAFAQFAAILDSLKN